MCGLSGEVRFDGGRPDLAAIERMTDVMEPRGPDGRGAWSQGAVALGHRRLKIIDLSERGAQPMTDARLGLTAVFNGCVYNHREVRRRLEGVGHRFFSDSDTEVFVKAYAEWGRECVDHLVGMFAFAVVEHHTGRVVLGRDRLGIKPLYVTQDAARLRFASTLPALLAGGGVDTSIDPVALHQYMSWHGTVPAPRTVLAGVRKVPPATVRVIEPDGTQQDHCYWQPSYTRHSALGADPALWREAVHEALRTAVRRRTVADVPVGVLLSGGLDSSLIVALLAEEGQEGLPTFAMGFESENGEDGDEFHYSDLVARTFSTDHHQFMIPSDRLPAALEGAIGAMSEPMVSHDAVAFHMLSEQVAKDVKVVLCGQGADEVFAGYHWYPPIASAAREDAPAAYADAYFDRTHGDLTAMLHAGTAAARDVSTDFVRAHMAAPGAETSLDAALRMDVHALMPDDPVKRVDNMTMAWGLEARVPFLDHELVELAAACPPELKLARGGKAVLKDIGREILPPEVVDRPKGYFPVPGVRHMAEPVLARVRDALTAPEARRRGIFDQRHVARLLAEPDRHRAKRGANTLWQVASLELWLQVHGVH
ncbi:MULTISPECIES: N-acetylglutaminylglutamine amidotransferase [unclassified Streptomyces]|uniref:N-acetylglutaminylglutamine amidotransferase n=1 Tax=unclassified Streptomyces TaxID=2593676 RepID=UPI00248203AB|nr:MULTISPECIES: N-acetylglutaminylglutamine amidotransferase [unclassified Streptomyces]MDA5280258.1 N-acetylglutaminylglutamine amidotransferase [Streptomyces sp. Isolate_45]MDX2388564.1 N-acetylglutaminylglutamine amidotransferase [Streptomyces sp. DK15]